MTLQQKIPYESLRAITFEKPLCTKSLLLDYLFLLRFCPSFFFFYRPAFVPSESTETNSIFLYYPVPTHTQRISHSSIFMTKRKPFLSLGSFIVARISHTMFSRTFSASFFWSSTFYLSIYQMQTNYHSRLSECFVSILSGHFPSYCTLFNHFSCSVSDKCSSKIFCSGSRLCYILWKRTNEGWCIIFAVQNISFSLSFSKASKSSQGNSTHNRCCYCFLALGEKTFMRRTHKSFPFVCTMKNETLPLWICNLNSMCKSIRVAF